VHRATGNTGQQTTINHQVYKGFPPTKKGGLRESGGKKKEPPRSGPGVLQPECSGRETNVKRTLSEEERRSKKGQGRTPWRSRSPKGVCTCQRELKSTSLAQYIKKGNVRGRLARDQGSENAS